MFASLFGNLLTFLSLRHEKESSMNKKEEVWGLQ